ncbi:MAG: DegT/DnrJ/EryC1/StrS family aminotransferase [Bryobacteraceae bacterium]
MSIYHSPTGRAGDRPDWNALRSKFPHITMQIPPVNFKALLDATEPEWRARLEEFFARQHFILGPELAAFEVEFARAMEARFSVGVGTGTAAIELCLRHAGITDPKQEVIAPALTAPFTGTAIVSAGCRIRFADIDPETLLMDPADVERRLTRRTAAIVPVHLYGQTCDMNRYRALAREAKAVLVQDACQAHGARWNGRPLTEFSRYVCHSFYPTKNLGALGDGGAITTNSAGVDAGLRMLRDGGRKRGKQVAEIKGINSRLDDMQCCFLRSFLPKLEEWNGHRRKIAAVYTDALSDCAGVTLVRTSAESVRHLYVIRVRGRERLRTYLGEHGIGTGIHYAVPLHRMPAFRECGLKAGDLPHAERACREVLSLPLWPYMPESAAVEVAGRIRDYFRK